MVGCVQQVGFKREVNEEGVIHSFIVYYATKAANIYTQLHVQEHNKKNKIKFLKTLKFLTCKTH